MNVNTWTSSLYNPNYCFTYRPCAMLVNWPCVMLIKWPYVMLIKWPCVMLLNWPCAMLIKWPCVMTCVMLIDWPCLMITDLACWFAWWPADANWLTLRDDLRDDNWPCVLTCVMTCVMLINWPCVMQINRPCVLPMTFCLLFLKKRLRNLKAEKHADNKRQPRQSEYMNCTECITNYQLSSSCRIDYGEADQWKHLVKVLYAILTTMLLTCNKMIKHFMNMLPRHWEWL